jgi:hypothetical protein
MAKVNLEAIHWLPDVEEHDYNAAESYLSLIYAVDQVADVVARFKNTPIVKFKVKDLSRASRLPLLGVNNSEVEKDMKKIRKGQCLSPILLLRDNQNGKVVIADGYHRLCAVYKFNEDEWIPCKIA